VTTICWTVIHHAAAPVARGAAKIAHVARRIIGPAVRQGGRAAHHGSAVVTHPRVWFELVCKVVPAAVAGGGLLIPHPTGPLPGHEPLGLIQPALPGLLPGLLPPGLPPGAPSGWIIPPEILPPSYYAPPTETVANEYPPPSNSEVVEPSTALLLLTALLGLLLVVRSRPKHPYDRGNRPTKPKAGGKVRRLYPSDSIH
jgi:hypothetical protein